MLPLGLFLIIFWIKLESYLFAVRRLHGRRQRTELALLLPLRAHAPALVAVGLALAAPLACRPDAGQRLFLDDRRDQSQGMPFGRAAPRCRLSKRQVLSSRNVTSHPVWDFLFGGLNYQIEHHLFPTMPRIHFKRARAIIRPFCLEHGLEYEVLDPLASYRLILVRPSDWGILRHAGHVFRFRLLRALVLLVPAAERLASLAHQRG